MGLGPRTQETSIFPFDELKHFNSRVGLFSKYVHNAPICELRTGFSKKHFLRETYSFATETLPPP